VQNQHPCFPAAPFRRSSALFRFRSLSRYPRTRVDEGQHSPIAREGFHEQVLRRSHRVQERGLGTLFDRRCRASLATGTPCRSVLILLINHKSAAAHLSCRPEAKSWARSFRILLGTRECGSKYGRRRVPDMFYFFFSFCFPLYSDFPPRCYMLSCISHPSFPSQTNFTALGVHVPQYLRRTWCQVCFSMRKIPK